MKPSLALILLVFSGFAVTDAQARPRTVADTISTVSGSEFTLAKQGPAILSGLWLAEGAGLNPGEPVEIKALPTDRHGRTPVILYKRGAKTSWQEQLLAAGRALAYDRAAIPKAWLEEERRARLARVGFWAKPAVTPDKGRDHYGEFRVVEGMVMRTYQSRDMYYINFGEDWKTDFSLRIPRRAWRGFGKNLLVAEGTHLRARGVIFDDNGPMIEITRPEQREVVHAESP